jgi:hypothetical protein
VNLTILNLLKKHNYHSHCTLCKIYFKTHILANLPNSHCHLQFYFTINLLPCLKIGSLIAIHTCLMTNLLPNVRIKKIQIFSKNTIPLHYGQYVSQHLFYGKYICQTKITNLLCNKFIIQV